MAMSLASTSGRIAGLGAALPARPRLAARQTVQRLVRAQAARNADTKTT